MSELFSIKAGRAFRREGANFVDADPAKGLLLLEVGDDGLLYLRWRTRDGNTSTRADTELVIFPSDASFERVSDEPSVRMYILKFQSSDQLHFVRRFDPHITHTLKRAFQTKVLAPGNLFLLAHDASDSNAGRQEPDASQDATNIEKINKIMTEFDMESASFMEESLPGNPVVPSDNNATQAVPPATLNPDQLNLVVQEIIRGIQRQGRAGVAPDLALTDILTPATLAPLLQDPKAVDSLAQFLPTDITSLSDMPVQEMLRQTVTSAPFRASVRSLDQALSTGLLGGLVVNLGMPTEAGLGIHPFLEAVKAQAAEQSDSSQDDDNMNVE